MTSTEETGSERSSAASPLDAARIEALATEIDERGFAIAQDVIPESLRQRLTAGVDRTLRERAIPFGANEFLGHHTRRIFNLLARDPVFEAIPVFAGALPLVDRLLDDECLLSSLTAIEMSPGQAPQPLHCDDGSYGFPRPSPRMIVVALWALTDFTRENGGTHVVPGSHRADRRPRRGEPAPTIQVEMPAGSILFYDGSLWHGGGENRSDARRLGLVANYCAGFLRQEESQLLAIPRERVAGFPPRLRRLVGYGTYRGLIGHVDQRNPETLVDPRASTDMIWSRIRR